MKNRTILILSCCLMPLITALPASGSGGLSEKVPPGLVSPPSPGGDAVLELSALEVIADPHVLELSADRAVLEVIAINPALESLTLPAGGMQKIQAKMKCDRVTDHVGNIQDVNLSVVTGDSEENKTFSRWTPSGGMQLSITNPSAIGAFVPGHEYIIDITPADLEPG